jgi:hypothetical protein
MRIARVLHPESSHRPILALERDGALYQVAGLARATGHAILSAEHSAEDEFRMRVIALGGAGLAELDAEIAAGQRPTSSRLKPGTFVWLAPCDVDRGLRVHVDTSSSTPRIWAASLRGLVGHEGTLPCPPSTIEVRLSVELAAVLSDDLHRASEAEAARAIVGFTLLVSASSSESPDGPETTLRASTQLGPVLVTPESDLDALGFDRETTIAASGAHSVEPRVPHVDPAQAIALASHATELRAGDVIAVGVLATLRTPLGAPYRVAFGGALELAGRTVAGWPRS